MSGPQSVATKPFMRRKVPYAGTVLIILVSVVAGLFVFQNYWSPLRDGAGNVYKTATALAADVAGYIKEFGPKKPREMAKVAPADSKVLEAVKSPPAVPITGADKKPEMADILDDDEKVATLLARVDALDKKLELAYTDIRQLTERLASSEAKLETQEANMAKINSKLTVCLLGVSLAGCAAHADYIQPAPAVYGSVAPAPVITPPPAYAAPAYGYGEGRGCSRPGFHREGGNCIREVQFDGPTEYDYAAPCQPGSTIRKTFPLAGGGTRVVTFTCKVGLPGNQ